MQSENCIRLERMIRASSERAVGRPTAQLPQLAACSAYLCVKRENLKLRWHAIDVRHGGSTALRATLSCAQRPQAQVFYRKCEKLLMQGLQGPLREFSP